MIYITGDTHGDQSRFALLGEHGEPNWIADDYLIICGDFGYIFANDERENAFLDVLAKKPYTICFIDGNHENFPAIFNYPMEMWNGGKIHRIRHNIIHLMRGQVFKIDDKTFFTMGGAYSIDRYVRTEGISYWKEELPNNDEYHEASASLESCNYSIDYIITHTAPREIIFKMGYYPNVHSMEFTGFLEWIMYKTKYKEWFFGHWHLDNQVDEKFRALLLDVVAIE